MRVIGLGKAFKIDFDEVLVRAELVYQTRQRSYACMSAIVTEAESPNLTGEQIL